MESINIKELNDRIQKESSFVDILTMEMNKVIVGQKHLVENLLIGLLANGHILLEGVELRHGTPLASRDVPGERGRLSSWIWNLGFFPNDARKNCPFVLTSFTGWSSESGIHFINFILSTSIISSPPEILNPTYK